MSALLTPPFVVPAEIAYMTVKRSARFNADPQ
jgi:hypothetical protein